MRLLQLIVMCCILFQPPLHAQYASVMWYTHPAINWNEALPLGNGRLGAMVFGGVLSERLSLNESSLWSGGPRNWNNPSAQKYLKQVRTAVEQKKYRTADSLAKYMQGPYTESYLPLADLGIHYTGIGDSAHYRRQLNLDSAVSRVTLASNGKVYTRTSFVSFPDQVIVYNDSCNEAASISYRLSLTSKLHYSIDRIVAHLLKAR